MFHRLRATLSALIMLMTMAFAGSVAAQTSFNFTAPNYTTVGNSAGCTIGDCGATYTTAMNVTGTITFTAPLAPNLVSADVGLQIASYSFNDGQRTYSSADPTGTIYAAQVTTDGAGVITNYVFLFERLPGPPYPINTPADPNSYFSYMQITAGGAVTINNTLCGGRGGGLSAASNPVSVCNSDLGSAERSTAQVLAPVSIAPASTVPTLSEWAMILFGVLLACGAAVMVQRRRPTA